MPKNKQDSSIKRKTYIRQYPDEFYETNTKLLWCRVCDKSVNYQKKSYVDQHRTSKKHQCLLLLISNTANPVKAASMLTFNTDLVEVFLKCDIPLNKLRIQCFKDFLIKFSLPTISQSTGNNMVKDIALRIQNEIIKNHTNKKIFMIIDESYLNEKYIVNILIGDINFPNKSYLVDCIVHDNPVNSDVMIRVIDDAILKFNIIRQNFVLLISDAATYMIKAVITLKKLFPCLYHITCISHLLHNCCLKIKNYFPKTNNLISSIKSLTVKNTNRRNIFRSIGMPPQPIVTRWGSWLEATNYYIKNLYKVRIIVNNLNSTGKIVKSSQEAVSDDELETELVQIQSYYEELIPIIDLLTQKKLNIKESYDVLRNIKFNQDVVGIKQYIDKRLEKNEISKLVNWQDSEKEIDLELVEKLLLCQSTSIDVERSFSILKNILRDNRNFSAEKLKYYLICYFNK